MFFSKDIFNSIKFTYLLLSICELELLKRLHENEKRMLNSKGKTAVKCRWRKTEIMRFFAEFFFLWVTRDPINIGSAFKTTEYQLIRRTFSMSFLSLIFPNNNNNVYTGSSLTRR